MLAEAFWAKWRSLSRLLTGSHVSISGYESRPRIRNLGQSQQPLDVFGRCREYPLGQLSLHLVEARLLGVIAFCLPARSKNSADEAGAYQQRRRAAVDRNLVDEAPQQPSASGLRRGRLDEVPAVYDRLETIADSGLGVCGADDDRSSRRQLVGDSARMPAASP
jgi:hypothetical protein